MAEKPAAPYTGIKQVTMPARVDKLYEALDFIDTNLETAGFDRRARADVMLASEEIFVNIAGYSYPGSEGDVTLQIALSDGSAEISFLDSGIPYDPLSLPDPDINAGLHDRPVGGLGVYMVKELTDGVRYRYEDNRNILTIWKKVNQSE